MTKEQQISAYNRLQGTMVIIDEMIRLYDTPAEVLGELLVAYQALKMAQNSLGWDPGQKSVEGSAK